VVSAAAFKAAAKRRKLVSAIVCRGGRPDLAHESVTDVRVPVLLLVAGLDDEILRINQRALKNLHTIKSLEVVDGASHFFEEPGKLEAVAGMAGDWFMKHVVGKEIAQQATR
jgi:putative phosphoribosyl transferase